MSDPVDLGFDRVARSRGAACASGAPRTLGPVSWCGSELGFQADPDSAAQWGIRACRPQLEVGLSLRVYAYVRLLCQ